MGLVRAPIAGVKRTRAMRSTKTKLKTKECQVVQDCPLKKSDKEEPLVPTPDFNEASSIATGCNKTDREHKEYFEHVDPATGTILEEKPASRTANGDAAEDVAEVVDAPCGRGKRKAATNARSAWMGTDPILNTRSIFCARLPSDRQKEQAKRVASRKDSDSDKDSEAEEMKQEPKREAKRSRVSRKECELDDNEVKQVTKRSRDSSASASRKESDAAQVKASAVAIKPEPNVDGRAASPEHSGLRHLSDASLSPNKLEILLESATDQNPASVDINSVCVSTHSEDTADVLDQHLSKNASAGFNVSLGGSEVDGGTGTNFLVEEQQDTRQESEAEAQASLLEGALGLAAALGALAQEATVSESGCHSRGGNKRTWKGWTPEEDVVVKEYVAKNGPRRWSQLALTLPDRRGKDCRERWLKHLDPEITKAPWSEEEDQILIDAHGLHGNKWSIISKLLPGRTDYAIKNRFKAAKFVQHEKALLDAQQNQDQQTAQYQDMQDQSQQVLCEPTNLAVDTSVVAVDSGSGSALDILATLGSGGLGISSA